MSNTYIQGVTLNKPIEPHLLIGFSQVDVIIKVEFGELINAVGIDALNDLADEKIHNYEAEVMLADIRYSVVGCEVGDDTKEGAVLIRVQAELERD
jgi:hypothetical protein